MQIWISPQNGWVSEQVPAADEYFPFINATSTQPDAPRKACSTGGALGIGEVVNKKFQNLLPDAASQRYLGARVVASSPPAPSPRNGGEGDSFLGRGTFLNP